ncbi:MAG: hypothetical protein LBG27_11780 [Spirochaetaceae bacterium]|jgi:hypothetical protein|nr:hypothetical protein [Spirochaetaceae bacterium]
MEDSELKIGPPDPNVYPNVELNYYYSREKWLEKMPDRVKSGCAPPSRKGGVFRSLTNTTPKLMLFITIAVLSLVIVVLRYAM